MSSVSRTALSWASGWDAVRRRSGLKLNSQRGIGVNQLIANRKVERLAQILGGGNSPASFYASVSRANRGFVTA